MELRGQWRAAAGAGFTRLRGIPRVVAGSFPSQQSRDLIPPSHHNQTGLVLSLYPVPTHFTSGHKCPAVILGGGIVGDETQG